MEQTRHLSLSINLNPLHVTFSVSTLVQAGGCTRLSRAISLGYLLGQSAVTGRRPLGDIMAYWDAAVLTARWKQSGMFHWIQLRSRWSANLLRVPRAWHSWRLQPRPVYLVMHFLQLRITLYNFTELLRRGSQILSFHCFVFRVPCSVSVALY